MPDVSSITPQSAPKRPCRRPPATLHGLFSIFLVGSQSDIDVYAKSEKEDLTDGERREIRKLVVALEAEG